MKNLKILWSKNPERQKFKQSKTLRFNFKSQKFVKPNFLIFLYFFLY